MFLLFSCEKRTADGERRDTMAKFINYKDWLEIKNGLKEDQSFTEIERRLRRDRTTNYQGSQELFDGTGYEIQRISP